ncbi:MAG: Transcriptional regulator PadR-like family protein [Promethearchaeota archaeon]|nr:MAG: Transcriptional regulator PadR-like family protein [Candidatus Lokiarchaeota archaeon]
MTDRKRYELSHREYIVLGLVSEEPSHAYELNKKIEDRGMRDWTNIGASTIYNDLNTLDDNGLVESYTEEVDNRIRRVYKITPDGSDLLKAKTYNVLKEYYGKNDENFYVAFSMLPLLSQKEQIEVFSHSIEKIKEHIKNMEQMLEQSSHFPMNVTGLFIHPIKVLCADLEFLEWALEEVKKGRGVIGLQDYMKNKNG